MSSSVPAVQPGRIRVLKQSADARPAGPVVYWMFRDQRLKDNWALIHAVHQANQWEVPVAIAFNLFNQFKGAKARQLGFMLRGLKKLHSDLQSTLDIPFYLFQASLSFRLGCPAESGMVSRVLGILVEAHFGEAVDSIPSFLKECGASLLVTDFSPLREVRQWKEEICKRVNESVSIQEVDAHNVVPVWVASDKLEYGARTIRNKINKKLPEYLVDFPDLRTPKRKWATASNFIDWDNLIASVVRQGAEVPELEWCEPGERAALEISAQRCALEAQKIRKLNPQLVVTAILKAVDAFLEELIVRRELADNFCFYQPHYDSLQGAWEWARKTLMDHAADKREHLYTREQLEKAQTADPVSTQCRRFFAKEYHVSGILLETLRDVCPIHLFLSALECFSVRNGLLWKDAWMYWAKKILEWTSGPEEALATAIYLNDKQYHIDGRDPNGYVGCMWSICGVHDQGWQERPIFGKIRYMNYAGCKRKFDVDGYIAYIKRTVGECKKRKAEALLNNKAKELRS
ncbi:hypothetical protein DH2020_005360 [Rehmannia glutinosa]|uniref:Photolyase/cryptochrome alpha/beta domain-containing protein n=1 Tax=Rehmannia glutinosa TaxID=99300 RepID=A0ABR0XFW7_REHGL